MSGISTRPAAEASDYFVRQATDPDGLAAELDTPDKRQRYIATFYTSRFWAHPGAFTVPVTGGDWASSVVDFHTEPFTDGAKLRASFGGYESTFSGHARSEPAMLGPNPTSASSSSVHPTTCSIPISTRWPPWSSRSAWAVSPSATAVTSPVGGTRTAGLRTRLVLRRSARVKGLIRATGGRTINTPPMGRSDPSITREDEHLHPTPKRRMDRRTEYAWRRARPPGRSRVVAPSIGHRSRTDVSPHLIGFEPTAPHASPAETVTMAPHPTEERGAASRNSNPVRPASAFPQDAGSSHRVGFAHGNALLRRRDAPRAREPGEEVAGVAGSGGPAEPG